jgi:CubicO group peptidase (beta-lactamase class C family)
LGAGSDASWSLDSKRSRLEKMESGLNATALDHARFGLLFLHGGEWNGRRVVARDWVRDATRTQKATDFPNPYGYFWWIDGKRPDRFYAFGNYSQYIYVDPRADVVVVRLGERPGVRQRKWLATFRAIADQVAVEFAKPTKASGFVAVVVSHRVPALLAAATHGPARRSR